MSIRRESRHEAYDVIVIGSDMGGLSAAALLAKAGKKTLVVLPGTRLRWPALRGGLGVEQTTRVGVLEARAV